MSIVIKQGLKKRPKTNYTPYTYNKEKQEKQPLTIYVDDLSEVRLWRRNNTVLAKQLTNNKDARSESGLYLVGDTDFRPSEHVDREFEIVSIPDGLYYKDNWREGTKFRTDEESMEWKTEIETRVGDRVWCEYLEAIEAPIVKCKGETYKLLKYYRLFVILRGDEIIPINGYCLCSEIDEKIETSLVTLPTKDSKRLKVEYVGKPNQEYRLRSDGRRRVECDDVKPGDIVVVNTPYRVRLEGDVHQKFDKPYLVLQRHNMDCVIL